MELVELDRFTAEQYTAIVGTEREPWGGQPAEALTWADKQRYVVALEGDGGPVGVAGALIGDVEAAAGRFQVVGLGGLIVAARHRRAGLGEQLMQRLLEIAASMGPTRAMLFCRPVLVERYRRHGFLPIEEPVLALQPGGRVEMPLESMWRALDEGATWPEGPIELLGLPF